MPSKIQSLVDRFRSNLQHYRSPAYNETQLRREFLDPFFKSLQWDVTNEQGYAEAYKEVIHEDSIKVGGATKAPDYCFRIGGVRKFFVEAKKPAIKIEKDPEPAFQLRRYGWSAKLPLSILTDFEHFAVYDCRRKPVKKDKASTARILLIQYDELLERWNEIESVFSKQALLKGSFDQYVESNKAKKGTSEVDDAFLSEIESWREVLAKNIALRNTDLSTREINFVVQRTIDRIVFLRICEDRGIEEYATLKDLTEKSDIYSSLLKRFHNADAKYNSGLFHFKSEKDRPDQSIDEISPSVTIDDKQLKGILRGLYYPDSPYEFSVLPSDILGQVYEQFLGKVIRLTPARRVAIEERPEVKRAGGVFYTPTFIVQHMVEVTLGRALKGKKAGPRGGASKVKVLDPACGSGTFLLEAYQHLLDWHLEYYLNNDPEKWSKGKNPALSQSRHGDWRLTTTERKRILLNNIYGVDIDYQAVEVAKLSLLLKVLEGEDQDSLSVQLKLFHERALPDLANNIRCGNSIIASDFFDQTTLSKEEEEAAFYEINPFDWNEEFPSILPEDGFDVIIGNPPYVDIKTLPEHVTRYIFSRYNFANNRVNLFTTFIEKSLDLLRPKAGMFSMIVPTAVLSQSSYKNLRESITKKVKVEELVRLPNESFGAKAGDVKVDTVIAVLENSSPSDNLVNLVGYAGYDRIIEIDPKTATVCGTYKQADWSTSADCVWSVNTTAEDTECLRQIEESSIELQSVTDICLGLTPYDKYQGHTQEQIKNKVFHATTKKDKTFKKLLKGNDVRRYEVTWNGEQWISYGPWLAAAREQRFFTEKRILVKQIIDWTSKRIWAALTEDELYNTQNAFNLIPNGDWSHEALLGILNSRLMTYYHRKKFLDEFKMRFQKILIQDCRRFPLPVIDFDIEEEAGQVQSLANKVSDLLSLLEKYKSTKDQQTKNVLKRQLARKDKEIDEHVFALYGLNDADSERIMLTVSAPFT